MSDMETWAYLKAVVDGPSVYIHEALAAGRSPNELEQGIRNRASWLGPLSRETENRFTVSGAEQLDAAGQLGFSLVHPESREWPRETIDDAFYHAREFADASSRTDPRELTAPHGLWVCGNPDLRRLTARAVGIVGTRAATAYGLQVTTAMCSELASQQYTIVSGGALGIDTAAHRAALDGGAPTMVVMASGPGFIYPLRNTDLFAQIVDGGGALISEYAPGTPAERFRFLVRNRLVAALTQGTVITEAPFRSGALNTMKRVEDFGRLPMAVPGPISAGSSHGTNNLIKNQRALVITDIREVHAHLSKIGSVDVEAQLELEYAPNEVQQLSRNELRVYDVLPREGQAGASAEDIAEAAGLSIGLTVHLLVDLSKRSLVVREGNLWTKLRAG